MTGDRPCDSTLKVLGGSHVTNLRNTGRSLTLARLGVKLLWVSTSPGSANWKSHNLCHRQALIRELEPKTGTPSDMKDLGI